MRSIRQPLDDLPKKDNEWTWSARCQQAFESIKGILNSDLLLTHYDLSLEVIVAADASEHGVGAVIQHRWPDGSVKAIARASCSLKPAEQNYSQIEKEGLAQIFAVKKIPQVHLRTEFHTPHRSSTPVVDIWEPQGHSSSFS
jgi:hypothetical protein